MLKGVCYGIIIWFQSGYMVIGDGCGYTNQVDMGDTYLHVGNVGSIFHRMGPLDAECPACFLRRREK